MQSTAKEGDHDAGDDGGGDKDMVMVVMLMLVAMLW